MKFFQRYCFPNASVKLFVISTTTKDILVMTGKSLLNMSNAQKQREVGGRGQKKSLNFQ